VANDGNALELLLVFDDAASPYLQGEIPEIGRFITDQRANTLVGLAWLHAAGAEMAVLPTVDHKRAIQACTRRMTRQLDLMYF